MVTKEAVKQEIDLLPDYLLDDIFKFINQVKMEDQVKRKVRTHKLKGQFDDLNIRETAYE